ncbi:unnamed protein product, partial [Phaeothamnion confervicola]
MAAPVTAPEILDLLKAQNASIDQCCTKLLDFIRSELGSPNTPPNSLANVLYARDCFPQLLDRVYGMASAGDVRRGSEWMLIATQFYDDVENLMQARQDAIAMLTAGAAGRRTNPISRMHLPGGGTDGAAAAPAVPPPYIRLAGMTKDAAAIVRLLMPGAGGSATVFQLLTRRQAFNYSFPAELLPPPTCAAASSVAGAACIVRRNERLFTDCLDAPLPQQLWRLEEEKRAWDMRMSYQSAPTVAVVPQQRRPFQLTLTMAEKYFFSFARYAAVTPISERVGAFGGGSGGGGVMLEPSVRMLRAWLRYGVVGLTAKNPYNTLVLDYAIYFFPHGTEVTGTGGRRSDGRGSGAPGGGASARASSSEALTRFAELFLRSAAEFWINQNQLLRADETMEHLQEVANRRSPPQGASSAYGARSPDSGALSPAGGTAAAAAALTFGEPVRDAASVEVVYAYIPPPPLVLHALLVLCTHLLADPDLKVRVGRGPTDMAAATGRHGGSAGGYNSSYGGGGSYSGGYGRYGGGRGNGWGSRGGGAAPAASPAGGEAVIGRATSPALAVLQPLLFDFLRAALCHCGPEAHASALLLSAELWLLWLQPWSAVRPLEGHPPLPADGGGDAPSIAGRMTHFVRRGGGADTSTGYSEPWKTWVLANHNFYGALLVAFVRYAVRLSYAPPD